MRDLKSGEEFTVVITAEGIPDTVAGPLALKRTDTGVYLPVKGVFGYDSQVGILDYSAEERKQLEAAGLLLTVRPIIKQVGPQQPKHRDR